MVFLGKPGVGSAQNRTDDGVEVRPTREFKYLRVWLSEDLSWGRQTRVLSSHCFTTIRAAARSRLPLSTEVRLIAARSLALVYLNFSSVSSSTSARNIQLLQDARNACSRFICNVSRFGHLTQHRRLGLLRLVTRVRLQCLVFLHRRFCFREQLLAAMSSFGVEPSVGVNMSFGNVPLKRVEFSARHICLECKLSAILILTDGPAVGSFVGATCQSGPCADQ